MPDETPLDDVISYIQEIEDKTSNYHPHLNQWWGIGKVCKYLFYVGSYGNKKYISFQLSQIGFNRKWQNISCFYTCHDSHLDFMLSNILMPTAWVSVLGTVINGSGRYQKYGYRILAKSVERMVRGEAAKQLNATQDGDTWDEKHDIPEKKIIEEVMLDE